MTIIGADENALLPKADPCFDGDVIIEYFASYYRDDNDRAVSATRYHTTSMMRTAGGVGGEYRAA